MPLALLDDAIDSTGRGVLFVAKGARLAEFVAVARGLLLLLDIGGTTWLGEGDDGTVHPLLRCHELVLPAEKISLCTCVATLHFPFSFTSKMKQTSNICVIFILKNILNFRIQSSHKSSHSNILSFLQITTQHANL
jgi:hypothetical protein